METPVSPATSPTPPCISRLRKTRLPSQIAPTLVPSRDPSALLQTLGTSDPQFPPPAQPFELDSSISLFSPLTPATILHPLRTSASISDPYWPRSFDRDLTVEPGSPHPFAPNPPSWDLTDPCPDPPAPSGPPPTPREFLVTL